jgi:hypothetical protein
MIENESDLNYSLNPEMFALLHVDVHENTILRFHTSFYEWLDWISLA